MLKCRKIWIWLSIKYRKFHSLNYHHEASRTSIRLLSTQSCILESNLLLSIYIHYFNWHSQEKRKRMKGKTKTSQLSNGWVSSCIFFFSSPHSPKANIHKYKNRMDKKWRWILGFSQGIIEKHNYLTRTKCSNCPNWRSFTWYAREIKSKEQRTFFFPLQRKGKQG